MVRCLIVGVLWLGMLLPAAGEPYPRKTVTIVCPWSAGGGTDRVARFWADALQREFGVPFVVVNRTGGAGAVGHFAGAHAPPDGYTLTTITFELSTMHRMRISRLTYRDYECLLQMNADPAAIVVQADAPWQSLSEWLDAIRAQPGKLKMSGTSTGGAWDLARVGLLKAAGVPSQSVVWVPHPGAAPSLMELMGGHLDAICCSVPEIAPQLQNQQVRVLAVMSEQRLPDFPDLPTAREQGVDWDAVGWRGLALPKGTPPEIMQALETRCRKIAESDDFREFMQKNGFGITLRFTAEFEDFLEEQDQQWKSVVEAAGYEHGLTGNHDPGPLVLPALLALGLIACGGWEWWSRRRQRDARAVIANPQSRRRLLWISLALIAYVSAVNWLGFAVSTLVFLAATTRLLGARWWSALLGAALVVGAVWLLFERAFDVPLPRGVLPLW